ncbi:hypothetical protein LK08_32005 [Streptomyces sp. MUSC 125]|uniref:hypothetical protein n=1 Tax=unclassified Streptomyces TaxID=2593676 RepID=UPI00057F490E|nr:MULTISPECIES: hypothetical protein [unclassified Streptomyces]KIE23033.1 hypothetical protein LK08_32005 [Streptomyces sp. MUSC 125]MCH0561134.1 hypothetical protein [Streptomyces sp. MUM 16J]
MATEPRTAPGRTVRTGAHHQERAAHRTTAPVRTTSRTVRAPPHRRTGSALTAPPHRTGCAPPHRTERTVAAHHRTGSGLHSVDSTAHPVAGRSGLHSIYGIGWEWVAS